MTSPPDPSFESAVRLASEDNNFVKVGSESNSENNSENNSGENNFENNSTFSQENSPRTIDCLS